MNPTIEMFVRKGWPCHKLKINLKNKRFDFLRKYYHNHSPPPPPLHAFSPVSGHVNFSITNHSTVPLHFPRRVFCNPFNGGKRASSNYDMFYFGISLPLIPPPLLVLPYGKLVKNGEGNISRQVFSATW